MYYARRAYSVSNIWTLSDTIQGFTKHFTRGDNIVITNKNFNTLFFTYIILNSLSSVINFT